MSKSSPNVFLIAIVAGIVVIGGFLFLRGTPEEPDTTPPIADAGLDIEVEAGEEFTLDGSASSDDIGIESYRWQLGTLSGTGETVEFTLEEGGVYFATLTVTDAAGNTDQATIQISVAAPSGELEEPTPEPEPEPEPVPEPEPEPEPEPTPEPEPEPTPEPEPEPEPEPTPEPEPASLPEIDGQVDEGEYPHSVESGIGVTVSWANTEDVLYVALESPGSGWVAIGIDPGFAMSEANFIFGYVSGGETFTSDQFGTGMFSHTTDTSNGGTDDIIEYAGIEGTVIEFSIPMDSGDSYDKPLTPGGTYTCRVARSNSDNFTTKHSHKDSVTITLD